MSDRIPKEQLDAIIPEIYSEVRRIARVRLRSERADHTLSATEVANEVYLRLVRNCDLDWTGRAQILAAAAGEIRRVLVDHAKRHRAEKRGGHYTRVTLSSGIRVGTTRDLDVLAVDAALRGLAKHKQRCAQVVDLRVFAGMTVAEVATALGVSKRTVDDDWAYGRALLGRALRGEGVGYTA